jgi:GNAT superfamily N-acetyltransferase
MSPTFAVRPLAAADEPQWRALWAAYLDFYGTTLAPEVYDTTWARLMSGAGDEPHGLAAVEGDRLLGIAHYLFQRTCWKIERQVYLQDLFTSPDARGRGVARALIEHVYATADAAGAPAVYWLTQEFNYYGRILYDQVGVRTPFIRYNRRTA